MMIKTTRLSTFDSLNLIFIKNLYQKWNKEKDETVTSVHDIYIDFYDRTLFLVTSSLDQLMWVFRENIDSQILKQFENKRDIVDRVETR